jgi:hypothetical protein
MSAPKKVKVERDDLLEYARAHFDAGHRPIPVRWRDTGGLQPLVETYRQFMIRDMTEDEFNELYLDDGDLRWNIEGFGIITGRQTGVVGIDIDVKNGLDGFAWLKAKGIKVPGGLRIKTPHGGLHVATGYPDGEVWLPKGDVGYTVNGPGTENRVGVEIKTNGDLFIVYGPGYSRQNGILTLRRSKLDGALLQLVLTDDEGEDDEDDEFDSASWNAEMAAAETAPLPLDPAIPKRGYLREVVDFFSETTDVPPEYALSVGIAQLSALMTGRLAVEAWGDTIRSHLWIVFVSPPATRKTHAWKIGLKVLHKVGRDLQIPADATVPALIQYLANERPNEPNGFVFHSEMKRFLESCQQSWQAGTQDFMSELFDSLDDVGELRITRKTNIVHNPSVAIFGGLTDAGFAKYARTSAILDGYLTRFIFVFRDTGPIPGRGLRAAQVGGSRLDEVTAALRARFRLIRDVAGRIVDEDDWPHIVPITDKAVTIFDEYADRLKEEAVEPGIEGFRDRVMTQVLKVAMVYMSSRAKTADGFEIRSADVRHAIAFMDYHRTRAWPYIAMAAETQTRTAEYRMQLRVRVQELQKKQAAETGGDWTQEWVTKRNLQRSLTNMTARALDGYLETLETAGELRVKDKSAKRGQYPGGRKSALVQLTPKGWVRERWGTVG